MALLRVVDRDGIEHEVDAKTGLKVMENLRELDYGVAAICGGMCSCATCHVYVDPEWQSRLPAMMSDERELLAELSHHQDGSRLSCQWSSLPDLAGLRVTHRARRIGPAYVRTQRPSRNPRPGRSASPSTVPRTRTPSICKWPWICWPPRMTCARNNAVRAVVLRAPGGTSASGRPACDRLGRGVGRWLHPGADGLPAFGDFAFCAHGAAGDRRGERHCSRRRRGTGGHGGPGLCGKSSKFNLAYTNAGLTPDGGTSFCCRGSIGARRDDGAADAQPSIARAQALDWGLVNEVVATSELLARAGARRAAGRGASGAYGATKRLVAHSLGALESQMILESETIARHAVGAEGVEGIRAFLEKRKPEFSVSGTREPDGHST